jgi:hypothetical protein
MARTKSSKPRRTGGPVPTYAIAMAAGRDAGNKSMKAAGRSAWNEEDWDAAAAITEMLMALIPSDAEAA